MEMEMAFVHKLFSRKTTTGKEKSFQENNLTFAKRNESYRILGVHTKDQGMKEFLFTLGCYEGEEITVISILSDNYIVHVKGARYSIDKELARAILI